MPEVRYIRFRGNFHLRVSPRNGETPESAEERTRGIVERYEGNLILIDSSSRHVAVDWGLFRKTEPEVEALVAVGVLVPEEAGGLALISQETDAASQQPITPVVGYIFGRRRGAPAARKWRKRQVASDEAFFAKLVRYPEKRRRRKRRR
ncbi:MAG: hypothetical protein WD850_00845 [Candidatus Spechtbacterales bacterium]